MENEMGGMYFTHILYEKCIKSFDQKTQSKMIIWEIGNMSARNLSGVGGGGGVKLQMAPKA
jgi:hypothetical protein